MDKPILTIPILAEFELLSFNISNRERFRHDTLILICLKRNFVGKISVIHPLHVLQNHKIIILTQTDLKLFM